MLSILYSDDQLVAIDKPPGLLVHRTQLDAQEDVATLQLLRDQIGRHVWPVHRLDKGTSGLLLFALDADTAAQLGQQFEQGQVRKRYQALVRGWPPDELRCEHPLARDPERPSQGQPLLQAATEFRVRARFEWPFAVDGRFPSSRYALVEAWPETGRRHQIRRHLKHLGHPIVGDATHGKGAHNRAVAAHLGVQRLWLHACEAWLSHRGQPLHLRCPLPPEWSHLA